MTENVGGRRETAQERYDRNWQDLLQEMRVMQTGVQLIAGFLLTLPFTPAFDDLDPAEVVLYLFLVVLAGLTTALMLVPIATHRRLFRRSLKARIVETTHRIVAVALFAAALLVVGIITLIFSVVVGPVGAAIAGGGSLLVVASLLAALPGRLTDKT